MKFYNVHKLEVNTNDTVYNPYFNHTEIVMSIIGSIITRQLSLTHLYNRFGFHSASLQICYCYEIDIVYCIINNDQRRIIKL
jgi:hypothetical protein